jgi:predicted small lipoprotein YifL
MMQSHAHERRQMVAILLAAVALAGCGAEPPEEVGDAAPTPATTETTTEAPAAAQEIPPGSYEKMATREEALAEGVPEAILDRPDEFLGIDELHLVHTFHADGRFEQSANYTGGYEVGDRGRFSYDEDGRLVKEHHGGDDVTVFDWSYDDGVLTLTVHEAGGNYADRDDVDQAISRFYDAGVFDER